MKSVFALRASPFCAIDLVLPAAATELLKERGRVFFEISAGEENFRAARAQEMSASPGLTFLPSLRRLL